VVAIDRLVDLFRAQALLGMQVLGVAAAYYAGTFLSVLSTPFGLPVTSLWVSAGIALTCLLLFDIRIWPGIALGSFLSNMTAVPPLEALLVAMGNTIAPVGLYLLLRQVGFRAQFDRIKDAVSFVLLAFAAMSVSASIGTAALVTAGAWPVANFLQLWAIWWSSDVLGVLVLTPFLLVLAKFRQARQVRWSQWLELVGLLALTVALTMVATRNFGVLFLAFPLVVLAALRFRLNGVAPCALVVAAVAIDTAARGYGLFDSPMANVVILQVFNGTFVLTGLLLAAVITQWQEARLEIEQTYCKLAETVERLQQSMLPGTKYMESLRGMPLARTRGWEDQPADPKR
jgi:integral membrane sensor domain MASE1